MVYVAPIQVPEYSPTPKTEATVLPYLTTTTKYNQYPIMMRSVLTYFEAITSCLGLLEDRTIELQIPRLTGLKKQ